MRALLVVCLLAGGCGATLAKKAADFGRACIKCAPGFAACVVSEYKSAELVPSNSNDSNSNESSRPGK